MQSTAAIETASYESQNKRPIESRERAYRFGEFEIDLVHNELRRGGELVTIAPKSLAVLAYLVRHRDRLVSRGELLDQIWPDVIVGKGSLPQAVWEIRRALGDARGEPRFIRTKYNHGYRFVAFAEAIGVDETAPAPKPPRAVFLGVPSAAYSYRA